MRRFLIRGSSDSIGRAFRRTFLYRSVIQSTARKVVSKNFTKMSVSLNWEYRARSFCKGNVYARAGDENPTQCDVKEPDQRSQSDRQAAESYSDSWVHERYE